MGAIHDPKRRYEIGTVGFDDFLELVGGNAYGQPFSTGLRIPKFISGKGGAKTIYRALLFRIYLSPGDELVGIRQLATIGATIGPDGTQNPPLWLEERPIVTPNWKIQPDTFPPCWTLTTEPRVNRLNLAGPFDQPSFVFRDAGTAAVLYETAGFPTIPTAPGYLGLNLYTPPSMRGTPFLVLRDIRNPWDDTSFFEVRYRAMRHETIRFYCDVAQHDTTKLPPTISIGGNQQNFPLPALPPEELFLQVAMALGIPVTYWRVAGAAIVRRRKASHT